MRPRDGGACILVQATFFNSDGSQENVITFAGGILGVGEEGGGGGGILMSCVAVVV